MQKQITDIEDHDQLVKRLLKGAEGDSKLAYDRIYELLK